MQQVTAQTICDEDPCPGVGFTHRWYDYQNIHPLFPNCKFTVGFLLKTCPNGKTYFTLQGFSYKNYLGVVPPGCVGLEAYLLANPEQHQVIFEALVDRFARQAFDDKYDANPNDPDLKCPNGQFAAYTYLAQCTKFCTYDDLRPISSGGTGMSYVVPVNCGASGCCLVNHHICFDEATQTVIDTKTTTRIGPSIQCPPILGNTCPLVYTIQNSSTVGGTYDVPNSRSSGCLPNSCAQ